MRPVAAISGSASRKRKKAVQDVEPHGEEKRPVHKHEAATAPLRVPGKFAVVDDEVGVAPDGDRPADKPPERAAMALQHATIGVRDSDERSGGARRKDNRIVEASSGLKDRSAAASATEHGNVAGPAGRDVDLGPPPVRVAHDDEGTRRLPNPQDGRRAAAIGEIEQRLIKREVERRVIERLIDVNHGMGRE